jgi:hypothetical protein
MESKELSPFPAKKESKFDKIKSYYLHGKELTPELEETRVKMVEANNLLCKGYSPQMVVKFLSKNHNVSERQGYNIVKESKELFGSDFETSSKGEKHILYESFMYTARRALKKGDFKANVAAMKEAAKIKKAYSEKTAEGKDLLKLFNLNVTFTTDPAALKQPKEEDEIIDIPSEEVE